MITLTNSIGNVTKIYAKTFEHEAYGQIKKLINFGTYLESRVRIMPDAHAGKGCTVGTTMTITDRVSPSLTGVDIGCGMLTVKLKETEIDLPRLDSIINTMVPSGFNVHEKSLVRFNFDSLRCHKFVDLVRASLSIGSLGGGNHFIEVSRSMSDGSLYLIIHSGSRKLGGDICKYYQNKAYQQVNEMGKVREKLIQRLISEGREKDISTELKNIKKPSTDKDLASLYGSDFDDYVNDMKIAQEFAVENRSTIAKIIMENYGLTEVSRFETIHNYIDFDRMILRKGAVSAEKNEVLLIPINMSDGSLLCVGKGNEDWNYSAPHGAGRLMSRSKAKENVDMEEFKQSMKDVYSTCVNQSTIDEAPQAYKPIGEIVEMITDTVEVIDTLKPIYNFKSH